jgi:uncharacterized protein (DUF1919 family)
MKTECFKCDICGSISENMIHKRYKAGVEESKHTWSSGETEFKCKDLFIEFDICEKCIDIILNKKLEELIDEEFVDSEYKLEKNMTLENIKDYVL